ncbi:MAG: sulfite exporter TauE/SafE family protein [Campylobacterota bacterium]|nr:sulfite exporter TauE/SafE family protein [Campylobacterota bacterium]
MFEYLIYFVITLILSTVFSIAGLGSAVALVPTLNIVGVSFDLARASGLFVNFITTVTTSFLNFKNNIFDKKFVLSLVISSSVFAFIGAKISLVLDEVLIKTIFGYVLLLIASMVLFYKKPQTQNNPYSLVVLIFSGSIGGLFSGLLGIGGGSIISPILFLFGYDAKKISLGISFVIPFSSIVAFSSYASVIELDYLLLLILSIAAFMGGIIGNYLLNYKISSNTIKKILALALYIIAFKMLLFS